MDVAGHELGVAEDVAQEADIRIRALQLELAQRPLGAPDGVAEVAARMPGDHLGDQRVEVGVGGVAGVAVGVDPNPRPGRRAEGAQGAGGGADIAVLAHPLEVDSSLDRVAAQRGRSVHAQIVKRRALGNPKLALDQVESGHFLSHGVFNLEPGVGLNEGEVVVALFTCSGVDQELECAEIGVPAGRSEFDGCVRDSRAQAVTQRRRGRNLDQLLVAALDRALTLADMGHIAVLVADNLDLDVPCAGDKALDEERAVAERSLGLSRATLEGLFDLVCLMDGAHTAPAAAGDRLDHHRAAIELFEEGASAVEVDRVVCAGQNRDAPRSCQRPGAGLVAEQRERSGRGTDEGDARLLAGAGEVGVLGEESVAGMDGVAVVLLGAVDDLCDVEIRGGANSIQRNDSFGVLDVVGGGVV